jgi:hypothetical protein
VTATPMTSRRSKAPPRKSPCRASVTPKAFGRRSTAERPVIIRRRHLRLRRVARSLG